MAELYEIRAHNFKSLQDVTVPLGRLTVLVGPNAAGKSNLIDVVGFLRDAAESDLSGALRVRGGFGRVHFRGETDESVSLGVSCKVTQYASSNAPDDYSLEMMPVTVRTKGLRRRMIGRNEEFTFKKTKGPGRRIRISGSEVRVTGQRTKDLLTNEALGLSTLPRLTTQGGYKEVETLARLLSSFRVFDVDVEKARLPSATPFSESDLQLNLDPDTFELAADASNLSGFLMYLASRYPDVFEELQQDAREIIPGLREIIFSSVGGSSDAVVVELQEDHFKDVGALAEASFGSIRALALLALLHDPEPPALTCIEEFDHGLHPYAFDLLVERLRAASARTQLLLATHSPTLVNRLGAGELVVCERDPTTGASRIPAIPRDSLDSITAEAEKHGLRLGEVWFSGTLGGVLQA